MSVRMLSAAHRQLLHSLEEMEAKAVETSRFFSCLSLSSASSAFEAAKAEAASNRVKFPRTTEREKMASVCLLELLMLLPNLDRFVQLLLLLLLVILLPPADSATPSWS